MSGYEHARWCEDCQIHHGGWYVCEHYSDELTADIREESRGGPGFVELFLAAIEERQEL